MKITAQELNQTYTKNKLYTEMKKLIKSTLITLMFLIGLGLTTILAAQTETVAKDTLVVKQFSIDSPGGEFRDQLGSQEGRLKFRILAGTTTGLDARQILQWLENGTIKLKGIRIDTKLAVSLNEYNLSVPFEFEQQQRNNYLETELIISGSDWIADNTAVVSLYGGAHGVVNVSLIGEGKRLAGELVSSQTVTAQRFLFEPPDLSASYAYQPVVEMWNGNQSDKNRGGFFNRNRYWVMGAATLVATSTTALIMSGGESVTYLPEPPGRP